MHHLLDARLEPIKGRAQPSHAVGPTVWERIRGLVGWDGRFREQGAGRKLLEGPIGKVLAYQVGKLTPKASSCSR